MTGSVAVQCFVPNLCYEIRKESEKCTKGEDGHCHTVMGERKTVKKTQDMRTLDTNDRGRKLLVAMTDLSGLNRIASQ